MLNLLKLDPLSLKLFTLTIQLGSITAAAHEVGLSVAAASKRISDLEHYLEVNLLVRGKKGVVPTHAGSSLHQHALQVMARIEQLVVSMRHFESGAVGQLRIAVNASALSGFLPNILATYSANNAGVVFDIEEMLSEEAVRAVEMGMVELAIVGENTFIGSLESVVCDEDSLVLLIPNKHPLARQSTISFSQALSYEFIALSRSSSLSRLIGVQAELRNLDWRIRAQLRSFDAVCYMVEVGMGLALVPSKVVRNATTDKKFIVTPVSDLEVQRRLILIMRKNQSLSHPARKFLDCICLRNLKI